MSNKWIQLNNMVIAARAKTPSLRLGQAIYNAAIDLDPEVAILINKYPANLNDCYYNDDKIPDFTNWLTLRWDNG